MKHREIDLLVAIGVGLLVLSCHRPDPGDGHGASILGALRVRFGAHLDGVPRVGQEESKPASLLPPGLAQAFDTVPGGRRPRFAPSIPKIEARVILPERSTAPMRIEDAASGAGVEVWLQDTRDVTQEPGQVQVHVADGYLIYPHAHVSGATLLHRALPAGTEDFLSFEERPLVPSVAYKIASRVGVSGLRLVANTFEMLDAGGAPRLRVSPPYLVGADGIRTDATLSVQGCAVDQNPAAPWGRAVTAPGADTCILRVSWNDRAVVYPALLDPRWTTTSGAMVSARQDHTATLLSTGFVLVAGGRTSSTGTAGLATAELFNPATGTWAATGSMTGGRWFHSATQLGTSTNTTTSGRILIAGGRNGTASLNTAQLYTVSGTGAGAFVAAGNLNAVREQQTATLLGDGRVLFVGGVNGTTVLNTAALYSQGTSGGGTFAAVTGTMSSARRFHTATLLSTSNATLNGKVMIAGGNSTGTTSLSTVQIFDGTSAFTTITALPATREGHTATVLVNGTVLVTGGRSASTTLNTTSLFNPASGTGSWASAGTLTAARQAHTATLLPAAIAANGQVLLAGGSSGTASLGTAELWNGTTTWTATTALPAVIQAHTTTLLPSGQVLIAGGMTVIGTTTTTVNTARLYDASFALTCTTNAQCASGFCANGVCCDTACNGGCGACNLAGKVGTCSAVANATVCRAAVAGGCDIAETCNGTLLTCPANAFQPATTVCRGVAGTCDLAENCTGTSSACPADVLKGSGTSCRAAVSVCDAAEVCNGTSGACPADAFAPTSTVCRGAVGLCDVAENCTGTSSTCPADVLKASGTSCRAAVSVCDAAEVCNGTSGACPADAFAPTSTVCRGAVGLCDVAENCPGTSSTCPADVLRASGTSCRAAVGVCDAAEVCTGTSGACPADAFSPTSTVCRVAVGACDVAENCPGTSSTCPTDVLKTSGTSCRAAVSVCDVAEVCTGTTGACPADVFAPTSTVCRGAVGTCDIAENCPGTSSTCPADMLKTSGTSCRTAVSVCDVAEVCTGSSGACPTDAFAPASTVCRASAGVCDAVETCTGTSTACPADGFASASTVCRAAAPGGCDAAETCLGTSANCPPDGKLADGTSCNDGKTCTTSDVCTGGVCSGTTNCTAPASAGPCQVGTCDDATGGCVFANAAEGDTCTDTAACTPTATCHTGTCVGTLACADEVQIRDPGTDGWMLYHVWGSSPSDYYVAAWNGMMFHHKPTGVVSSASVVSGGNGSGLWGSSANDVYSSNGKDIIHSTGDDVWTVQPSPATGWITAIWGSSSSDVYAVGEHGTIVHKIGGDWIAETPPLPITARFEAVSGSSASDVFAAGSLGDVLGSNFIIHRRADGTGIWDMQISVPYGPGGALLVNSPTDVYAVGSWGAIMHRGSDGIWTSQHLPPTSYPNHITGIWAPPGGTPIYIAVGSNIEAPQGGSIMKSTGDGVWTTVVTTPATSPTALRGDSANSLWVVGWGPGSVGGGYESHLYHVSVDGTGCGLWSDGNVCTTDSCNPSTGLAVHVPLTGTSCSDGNACATGQACQSGACIGGTAVTCSTDQCHTVGQCVPATGCPAPVAKGDGTSCDDQNLCSSGDVCKAGVCNGSAPTCSGDVPLDPVAGLLTDVWGSGTGDVYASGYNAMMVHRRPDGSMSTYAIPGAASNLGRIWGTSSSNVYTVSQNKVFHSTGDDVWTAQNTPDAGGSLNAIWGSSDSDIYVADYYGGTIFHSTGNGVWSSDPSPVAGKVITGIRGSSAADVYAVGYDPDPSRWAQGFIIHRGADGVWRPQLTGYGPQAPGSGGAGIILNDVWPNSATDIYVVSWTDGTLLHSTGNGSWTRQNGGFQSGMFRLWAPPAGTPIFAFGSVGKIMRSSGAGDWTVVHTDPTPDLIYGLWGDSANSLWTVGFDSNYVSFFRHITLDGTGCDLWPDANPCTVSSCDPVGGVMQGPGPDGVACTDGTVCTQTDICQAGTCIGTNPLACGDDNLCTADYCDNFSGCVHAPVACNLRSGRIEAESFDSQNLVSVTPTGVTPLIGGSWLEFDAVDFGASGQFNRFNVMLAGSPGDRHIEFHLNSPDGLLVADLFSLPSDAQSPAAQSTAFLVPVSGVHRVAIVFGSDDTGTLDWFSLEKGGETANVSDFPPSFQHNNPGQPTDVTNLPIPDADEGDVLPQWIAPPRTVDLAPDQVTIMGLQISETASVFGQARWSGPSGAVTISVIDNQAQVIASGQSMAFPSGKNRTTVLTQPLQAQSVGILVKNTGSAHVTITVLGGALRVE